MKVDEDAARRWFGLFFWGIAILLSAWSWTIEHASQFGEVDKLLREAAHPIELQNACTWAKWFYWIDTLLFVPCYAGFVVLITRQLRRSLVKDLGPGGDPAIPNSVRLVVKGFLPTAITLLVALVAFDLAENAGALVQLTSYIPDVGGMKAPFYEPSITAAKIFSVATAGKHWLIQGLGIWLVAGTVIWLTGA